MRISTKSAVLALAVLVCIGRMNIAHRYFPQKEQERIAQGLSDKEKLHYFEIRCPKKRILEPFAVESERQKVWENWADKNIQEHRK